MFLPHEYLLFLDKTGRGTSVFICRHVFEEKLTRRGRGLQNGGCNNVLYRDSVVVITIFIGIAFVIYLFL